MKNKKFLLLLPAIFLAGCGPKGIDPLTRLDEWITGHFKQNGQEQFHEDQGITDESSDTEIEIKIDEETEEVEIVETDISEITEIKDGISYDSANKLFTITAGGEYSFKGQFEGNILVNAGDDDEVKVTLEGFTIKSSVDSPIKCVNAGELQVSIKKGTENFIYDTRALKVEDNDTQGNGAITSDCD